MGLHLVNPSLNIVLTASLSFFRPSHISYNLFDVAFGILGVPGEHGCLVVGVGCHFRIGFERFS
jgi:hypothetical protein